MTEKQNDPGLIKGEKIKIPELTSHVQTAKFILDLISELNLRNNKHFESLAKDALKKQLDIRCALSILCKELDVFVEIDDEKLYNDAVALSDEKWPEILKKCEDLDSMRKLINSVFKK